MIKRLTILMVLILLLVACGPQSPVGEEEEQPPALSEVEGAAQEPATTEPVKADQPSPVPEATSTQPEARPTEPDEASPEPTIVDKWTLWVDGPHLRGVDLHPCRLFTVDDCVQTITNQDIQDLRNQGANLINASYPGIFAEEPPYLVNPTTLKYLDDLIGWAEEVGIYVVIHFRTGPGRNEGAILLEGEPDFAVWSDQAAQDAWIEMWRFTAERYRGSPVVVGYDLMVEPHPNTLIDPGGEGERFLYADCLPQPLVSTVLPW